MKVCFRSLVPLLFFAGVISSPVIVSLISIRCCSVVVFSMLSSVSTSVDWSTHSLYLSDMFKFRLCSLVSIEAWKFFFRTSPHLEDCLWYG